MGLALSVVARPGKGRGVVAERAFKVGEVLEEAPVLVIPGEKWAHIEATPLYDYCFGWGREREHAVVGLGYSSLYNHSYRPNARYLKDFDRELLIIVAVQDIAAGDEVTINYNGDPEDQSPVWFEVKP